MDKYPNPREAQVVIDVREIDRLLNLPADVRVVTMAVDQFPPRIRVLIEGDRLPERPLNAEPEFILTYSELCSCGHRQLVWDGSDG